MADGANHICWILLFASIEASLRAGMGKEFVAAALASKTAPCSYVARSASAGGQPSPLPQWWKADIRNVGCVAAAIRARAWFQLDIKLAWCLDFVYPGIQEMDRSSLNKATSADDTPTPGYLYTEILGFTRSVSVQPQRVPNLSSQQASCALVVLL